MAVSESVPSTRPTVSKTVTGFARQWSDQVGLTIALIALVVFYAIIAPNFLTFSNLTNVMHQVAYVGIIAWGMTLVIIAAEIDVSVGSAAAFAGVLLAILLNHGWPWPLAMLAVIALGTVIGAFGGFLRATFLIPSFIVTLALYGALRGMALLLTDAVPETNSAFQNSFFTFLGTGDIAGVPAPAVLLLVLFGVFWFISTKTTFGKSVYAIGGNPEAAHLAGLPVARIRVVLFAITGCLAAVSGILLAAALGAGDPSTSQGLEFDVIAAVIVGGTNLYGGRGSIVGTFLGVLFIGILGNGLILLGINPFANTVVQGLVILIAVLVMSPGLRSKVREMVLRMRDASGRAPVADYGGQITRARRAKEEE